MRPFGNKLPSNAIDEFDQFCDKLGIVKWKGLRAAIGLIHRMPVDVQSWALRGEWDEVQNWLEQKSLQKKNNAIPEARPENSPDINVWEKL